MLTYVVNQGLALMRRARRVRACRCSRRPFSRPFVEAMGLVALGLLLGIPGKPQASFITAPTYPAGDGPSSVAVGDFNGDGHPDLVVANVWANGVTVLLGNGDGTFQAAQSFAVEGGSYSVAVGDFNGDGHLDLAVPGGPETVSILLGNGDATFQAPHNYAAGLPPMCDQCDVGVSSIAVGDFNGDGYVDLAVAGGEGVSVLLGNGDGSFRTVSSYYAGDDVEVESVAAGDFNGDGIPDLAVAGLGTAVSIFLGKGDGTFQAALSVAAPPDKYYLPQSLAVEDFNGDGIPDLAVASWDTNTVSILLGQGDGTFLPGQSYPAGYYPFSLTVGDFNGDGIADLVVANRQDTVSVLLGKGDGTFWPEQTYWVGGISPQGLVVGDSDGDGHLDVAVAIGSDSFSGQPARSVLLGKGDGTFQPPRTYDTGDNNVIGGLAVGDFNGDGFPDLAVIVGGVSPGGSIGAIEVFLGNGDGTFQVAQSIDYTIYSIGVFMVLGDVNRDGIPDLVVVYPGMVSTLLGQGDGTFQPAQSYAAGAGATFVAMGDFNGDGYPDLAVAAGPGVTVLLNAADWAP
jgi:hypothetical protein